MIAGAADSARAQQFLLGPEILAIETISDREIRVTAQVPAGYRHVILQGADSKAAKAWSPLIAGGLSGDVTQVQFRVPINTANGQFRITAGIDETVPEALYGSAAEYIELTDGNGGALIPAAQRVGHVLNRLAYGSSASDYQKLNEHGIAAWIVQQLEPSGIDEAANAALAEHENRLFEKYVPGSGQVLISEGETWGYFKGVMEPPGDWAARGFDDADWLSGDTGIGFGDDDDVTVLEDMRETDETDGYLSVYTRKRFLIDDPDRLSNLFLEIEYDDGFVAYLNGQEVARSNVAGVPPAFDDAASSVGGSVDSSAQTVFDLSAARSVLVNGENVLAIQGHNANATSSDFSLVPVLTTLEEVPFPSLRRIGALQEWIHVRGIHSERQLQAVMGEFWENHFTTDYDKVAEFLEEMDEFRELESDARKDQARAEAAQMEWEEYEFFYEHAFAHFGDLLLRSATSPSMNIYLDNVLNLKDAPNENYAREILELHAFGVDNRYTQTDIEQLAKCFTGWTLRKIHPDLRKSFPASARDPEVDPSRSLETSIPIIDLGDSWRYFKGISEPPADWATLDYDAGHWLSGPTGIGYDDDDDATLLSDMRDAYASVYLRKEFVIPDVGDDLVLELDYDDAYVLYLNGTEIARSRGLTDQGDPPPFDALATTNHEARGVPDVIEFGRHEKLLQATNVLAIQVHNVSLDSSDLSVLPRLLSVTHAASSIAVTDPAGVWTFRFDPEQHDTEEKLLFAGSSFETRVPAGRKGKEGVQDAIEVIDGMVAHPSTAEFIVIKLVNRFVSDGIRLETYQDRSAPAYLLEAVDQGIAAWHRTDRPGHIGTVLEALLDPVEQQSAFWKEAAHFSKVKSPIEFINSAYRALGADIVDDDLPDDMEDMAMEFFKRDDPDGYSELGLDWVDTLSVLERVRFCQALSNNMSASSGRWDIAAFLSREGLTTAEDLVDHFNERLFHGLLAEGQRKLFLRFAQTDNEGNPSPIEDLRESQRLDRLEQMVALILASPGFHFQ